MSDFVSKKVYLQGVLLHYFIQKKSVAEEFLVRLTMTMVCWKQHAEIGLDASKIMILMLIKNTENVWK